VINAAESSLYPPDACARREADASAELDALLTGFPVADNGTPVAASFAVLGSAMGSDIFQAAS
jgi:hypothetical protein